MVKEYFEVHNNNMDKNQHGQPVGEKDTPAQAYDTNQYQPNNMIAPTYPSTQAASLSTSSSYLREQQHAHHYIHQELQQQLNNFWANQYKEIEETTDFRNHSLPLARIKKIMKANEDVRMVSAEAPVIFAKACEMFIMELTMRARVNAEENKRRTLQNNDIAAAITGTDVFDFLVDVVSRDSTMDHDVYADIPRGGSAPIENVPYYYMPQHVAGPSYGAPRVVTGWPVPDQAHYGQQTHPFLAQIGPKQENHSSKSGD